MSPDGWENRSPATGASCSSRGASAHADDERLQLRVKHRVPGAAGGDEVDRDLGAPSRPDQPGHDLRLEYQRPWTRWARSNRQIKQGCPNQRVRRESSG
jgi:hypothetical protein